MEEHSDKNNDGQLYKAYLSEGDGEALRKIFEKYRGSVTRFLLSCVHNADDAEELMMDVFALLASGTVRYAEREDATFKTWLFAIARNKARAFLRRKAIWGEFLLPGDRQENGDNWNEADESDEELVSRQARAGGIGNVTSEPEEAVMKGEERAKILSALEKLPQDYGQALYLEYFEEMEPGEIARVMKKSVKQVYNLTARGKAALKKILTEK